MILDRRRLLSAALAGGAGAAVGMSGRLLAQGDEHIAAAQWALIFGPEKAFAEALDLLSAHGRPDVAPAMILALRYTRAPAAPIVAALEDVTGARAGPDWFDWMLWQEAHPEVTPHPSYPLFKRELMLQIDPAFDNFLKPEYMARDRMHIRLEEITWGGVRKDGIPSLDNPNLVTAEAASYLKDDDLIFGVAINGDVRAYPLRIMGWHEMFNEVIGGVPVALAYCTLCGSGILFETQLPGRPAPFVFGSSGFLYRSNKLMFDRETHSLWNQFTGKPVMGPLWNSGIELRQRPVVITRWDAWRKDNPDTRVLSLQTGHRRDYGSGVVYNDYFASDDLMFPTAVDQRLHKQKDYVFGLRVQGGAKAWPLEAFIDRRVINDEVAGLPVVLIGDAKTRTVRAYARGDAQQFSAAAGGALKDANGQTWRVGEESLTGPGGLSHARMAGHIAYWFAWNGYLGGFAELYEG
ncbi:MAG: DUF3179 domain-containing protein [Pseudomonadota bacterium]